MGVPGTTLTNWPDEYIHSSADDLWQIDPTQLKRNAFVVAATAWWLANAGAAEAATAASYVGARGVERLGEALSIGLTRIQSSRPPREADLRAAASLLAAALEKERSAVESVEALDPSHSEGVQRAVSGALTLLDQTARAGKAALLAAWGAAGGPRDAEPASSAAEQRLEKRTPRKAAATLAEWLALEQKIQDRKEREKQAARAEEERAAAAPAGRGKGKGKGKGSPAAPAPRPDPSQALSPLLQFEVLNWVDGKTDAATIARRVCAEAMAAGSWYYGEATPERVEKYLEGEVRDGRVLW